ncbi:transmembrane protein 222-like isoform X1 [Sinocyclocheilus grahami]|uniref:transmembrane protein 222-like isoform X1 n=1 Tax=Sinocyclocheilus grahami TaxID=75366 RepID=UPI0007AD37E1|nr:PREDICTED: transmembrane protein 222-like isoform X1 [Sinocyclocheilus grahami]
MADVTEIDTMKHFHGGFEKIDKEMSRYPHCIVWTPIPVLTWFLPFIGHMGICTSAGVIRDFAGPYFVSEDNMAFGKPTKFWKLDRNKVYGGGANAWDLAVHEASEEYKTRMLCGVPEDLAAFPDDLWDHSHHRPCHQPAMTEASTLREMLFTSNASQYTDLCI